jgi:hypothetical protein
MTSFWEAYCEDIASEALEHLVKYAKSANDLPKELRKQIAVDIKKAQHELEIADDGWREYLTNRLTKFKVETDKRLNTPKTTNIDTLFKFVVGIPKISACWKWSDMTVEQASQKLDTLITLRGAIAHRGKSSERVTRQDVEDYFKFIKSLAAKTGGHVKKHIATVTSEPLWTTS